MKQITLKVIKILTLTIVCLSVLTVLLFGYNDIPLEELKRKYTNDSSKFTSVNNMNVHYRDEGLRNDSIPVILIHGTGSSLHTFDNWSSKLSKTKRVVRMDLPGYGLTGPFLNRNYSKNNYVSFIKSFLDTLKIKKCILAGNSLGGNIAWLFTTKFPSKVKKLILIDASGYPNKSKDIPIAFKLAQIPIINNAFTYITPRFIAKKSVENVYADKSKVNAELVNRYFELTLRKGNRQAFVDRLAIEPDPNQYKKIKIIKQPVLILWGEEDMLTPVEMANRFNKDLNNSTLNILKSVGHVPMEESPDKSLDYVLKFLK